MSHNQPCYCKSTASFTTCCQPYILNTTSAPTAEALMRSRFSAYVMGDYAYILRTYGQAQRQTLSLNILKESSENTQWLSLEVIQHKPQGDAAQVEFKAYYQVDSLYYVMHEMSDFEKVDGQWFYTTGTMLKGTGEHKPERNSVCLCGSGRKFKRCCGG